MNLKSWSLKKKIFASLIFICLFLILWFISIRPSNERNWSGDQTVLSYSEVEGSEVKVYNIRNFTYRNTTDYDKDYYNKTFRLNNLTSIWFMVEPFSGNLGAAHTFLSFGFGDEYVAISVEIRKEKGEEAYQDELLRRTGLK